MNSQNFITLGDVLIIFSSFLSALIIIATKRRSRRHRVEVLGRGESDEMWLEKAIAISKSKIEGLSIKEVRGSKRSLPEWVLRNVSGVTPTPDCVEIRCGGWGCVYKCGSYAVKVPYFVDRLITTGSSGEITMPRRIIELVEREAELIKSLDHHNVLKLLGYSTNPPMLVYEYAEYGSLADLTPVSEPLLVKIGIQVAEGLRYLHSMGMCHEDVKPSNILIVGGLVKLGDFSTLVRSFSSSYVDVPICTRGYCAPEQIYSDLASDERRRGHECKVDIYQLANTLLSALGLPPIDGSECTSRRVESVLSALENHRLRELLRRMLSKEPWLRPSATEVLKQLTLIYEHYEH